MPDRILKEKLCSSGDIDRLTAFEETVFFRLLVNCDDYGRLDARPNFLKSKLFITKKGISITVVAKAVGRLAEVGLIACYETEGGQYLSVTGWEKHQRIRAKRSKYPPPPQSGGNRRCGDTSFASGDRLAAFEKFWELYPKKYAGKIQKRFFSVWERMQGYGKR